MMTAAAIKILQDIIPVISKEEFLLQYTVIIVCNDEATV